MVSYYSFLPLGLIGLDLFVLKRALQALEKRGKAKLLIDDNSTEEDGVKFFS